MGEIAGFTPYVFEGLQRLLTTTAKNPIGPPATYSAATGEFAEAWGSNIPTFTPSKPPPLMAAMTRVTGIQSLFPTYEQLKKDSILSLPQQLIADARRALDESVQKHLLSEEPNFSKFLASVDPRVRGQLAGRFVGSLFTKIPENERALIGSLPFNDAIRDVMFLNLVFHVYPGVADVAADMLADEYHRMFGPIVSRLSQDRIRAAVESYVDMFNISGRDRELAISQILRSPRRTTLAVVVGSGGYSIDALKDFLTGKASEEQIKSVLSSLLLGEGPENIKDLYMKLQEDRKLIGQFHTLPQIRTRPTVKTTITLPNSVITGFIYSVALPDFQKLAKNPKEPGILEQVNGTLASVSTLIEVTKGSDFLSKEELKRASEVIKHLHNRFRGNFPGVLLQMYHARDLAGHYNLESMQLTARSSLPILFHEFAHGLNHLALGEHEHRIYPLALANEISANAFGIAATAYVKGIYDHPLTVSAINAGLLPGKSTETITPFEWAIRDVIPLVEKAGVERSAISDNLINAYRINYAPYLGTLKLSENLTSKPARDLVRYFIPNIDELERIDSAARKNMGYTERVRSLRGQSSR